MDKKEMVAMIPGLRRLRLAFTASLVGFCHMAFSGVWYVDDANGSDANDGTNNATAFAAI